MMCTCPLPLHVSRSSYDGVGEHEVEMLRGQWMTAHLLHAQGRSSPAPPCSSRSQAPPPTCCRHDMQNNRRCSWPRSPPPRPSTRPCVVVWRLQQRSHYGKQVWAQWAAGLLLVSLPTSGSRRGAPMAPEVTPGTVGEAPGKVLPLREGAFDSREHEWGAVTARGWRQARGDLCRSVSCA